MLRHFPQCSLTTCRTTDASVFCTRSSSALYALALSSLPPAFASPPCATGAEPPLSGAPLPTLTASLALRTSGDCAGTPFVGDAAAACIPGPGTGGVPPIIALGGAGEAEGGGALLKGTALVAAGCWLTGPVADADAGGAGAGAGGADAGGADAGGADAGGADAGGADAGVDGCCSAIEDLIVDTTDAMPSRVSFMCGAAGAWVGLSMSEVTSGGEAAMMVSRA
ncbi:hypothetical protein MKX07_002696 [Trichoderma sp. CBMAI-0711]|nr:hypothetical protein MKX07_002696 [Trichoderma sp. CBMAI-0711]